MAGCELPIEKAMWRKGFKALLGILGNLLYNIKKLKSDIYKEILICDS